VPEFDGLNSALRMSKTWALRLQLQLFQWIKASVIWRV